MAVAGCYAKDTGKPLDALLNDISAAHGVDPVEMLGGAVIAEGGWNEHAIRERKWADVSYGFGQPSVAWCSKPDGLTPSTDPRYRNADTPENRAACKDYYWDAERALAYCTPLYAKIKAKHPTASALDCWCYWNKPNVPPADNPNRAHYARSLAEAETYRVVEEEPPVAEPGSLEERIAQLEKQQTLQSEAIAAMLADHYADGPQSAKGLLVQLNPPKYENLKVQEKQDLS